jgi:hypothetical protein
LIDDSARDDPRGYSSVTTRYRTASQQQKQNRRPKAAAPASKRERLVQLHALGERATVTRLDVKLYGLTLDEGLTTIALNLRVVNKDIRLAIDSDETPTLLVIEPLNGSYSHCGPPCFF